MSDSVGIRPNLAITEVSKSRNVEYPLPKFLTGDLGSIVERGLFKNNFDKTEVSDSMFPLACAQVIRFR